MAKRNIGPRLGVALELIGDSGPALVAINPQAHIVFTNSAASELFGLEGRDVRGEALPDVVQARDPDGRSRKLPSAAALRQWEGGQPIGPCRLLLDTPRGEVQGLCTPLPLSDHDSGRRVLAYLFHDLKAPAFGTTRSPLSPREQEVLRCLAEGLSTDRIARQCSISRTTVRNHVQNILRKLDVHSRIEAVAWARRKGLFG